MIDISEEGIEYAPDKGECYFMRGLDNEDEKEIEKGRKYLRMVPTLPLRLKTDPIDIEHSKMLLDDIQLCPGYSRDQQQEISEEKFKEIEAEKK